MSTITSKQVETKPRITLPNEVILQILDSTILGEDLVNTVRALAGHMDMEGKLGLIAYRQDPGRIFAGLGVDTDEMLYAMRK
ncbi:uncharacterized protein EAF01_010860 [Botrytis porri]|uniref:Uncharacterized protein n=1 Tax=Botrytis porri TaxID=87229 RepID=A0A4Z1KBI4_9HELO|nr:uncharacterized protein EAF01_010860 [Botrytis porri]KAF7889367.1 hypothetical protein EAF01_010860 [Botrytis porri]TGO81540.1 hypothetical protein BPOR_1110g00010 [Botrytis porri]